MEQRQLLFRAYDKHLGRFLCEGFSIIGEVTIFNGLQKMIAETPIEGISGLQRLSDLHITQWTGVLDVNDKKIFGGDKFEGEEQDDYYLVEYNSEEGRFQVNMYGYKMFHNEGGGEEYQQDIDRVDENCFDMSCLCSLEIIGNIYESPK